MRRLLIGTFFVGLPLLGALFLAHFYFYATMDWYAEREVVDRIIGYMEDHEGRWPPDWEALRPYYGEKFAQLIDVHKRRIRVDFSIEADDLRNIALENQEVRFHVVYPRWTIPSSSEISANQRLCSYFRDQAGVIEAPFPPGGWSTPETKRFADEWYRHGFLIARDRQGSIIHAWTHLHGGVIPEDEDLQALKKQPMLTFLNLVGAKVTDDGLRTLKELPNLKELDLSEGVSDVGVDHLVTLKPLERLDILGTEITDIGFLRLRDLPRLHSIRIDRSAISPAAINAFRKSRPDVSIH